MVTVERAEDGDLETTDMISNPDFRTRIDETLIVWDLVAGRERRRLRGHDGCVTGCAISADGGIGLSASQDQTLMVWDLRTGQPRHRLRGHLGRVGGCAISADGRTGISASEDRRLIVWDLTIGEALTCLALDSIAMGPALSPTARVLIGDRKGDVTCLELVVP